MTLAELSFRLSIAFWAERHSGSRLFAGSRGTIRAVDAGLEVVLRPSAVLQPLRRQLIGAGLLRERGGMLLLTRMPSDGIEAAALAELCGLARLKLAS